MTVVHQVLHTACQREEDRQEDRLERSLLGRLSLSSRNNNNVRNNITRELILHSIYLSTTFYLIYWSSTARISNKM